MYIYILTVLTYLPRYVNDGSCDFGLILVGTWDLGKVTFPVVGKCKVPRCVGVYVCVYGYGIYGKVGTRVGTIVGTYGAYMYLTLGLP